MIDASHNYSVAFNNDSIEWTFSNIILPDSNVNEPASHGFVRFKIDQKEGNTIGTELRNKAYIYFDYNEAIITNEALSIVAHDSLVLKSQAKIIIPINILPNPTLSQISIQQLSSGTYQIFKSLGMLIQTDYFEGPINAELLTPGLYFLLAEGKHRSFSGRFIKKQVFFRQQKKGQIA
jgi:hypothetical protein